MNPLRQLLSAIGLGKSPQHTPPRGVHHIDGPTRPVRVTDDIRQAARGLAKAPHPEARDFPLRPAAPTGPRPRGEAEVIRLVEKPDNSPRWDR